MKFDLRIRNLRRSNKRNNSFENDCALEDVHVTDTKKKVAKRVTFAEDRNEEHVLKPQSQAELSRRWYSEKDVTRFEYRTIQQLGQWLEEDKTASSLQVIYQGFHELEEDDLNDLLKSQRRMRLKESDIGLEMILLYGLPSQAHVKSHKRRQILKHVAYFQNKNTITANRTKDIAKAVSSATRASRRYAGYIAEKAYNI